MGGPVPGRHARSAGPVGRMGCIWPAKRYPPNGHVRCLQPQAPSWRRGASARYSGTARGRRRVHGRFKRVAVSGGRLRLGAARRAAGLDVSGCRKPASVSRFPPQAEAPQLCVPDCRQRHQARGPVDECSPGEPPCALLSLRVARGLAVRSSSASFTGQVRWRHGCGLLANGERPCRAHSAEPDIFVAQRAGGEGRLVRRRPVPVASSAEARGDDRHFLSPYLRSLLPCAGVPVASVDSPARITIRARKLPLQAELLERGAGLEVEPRRKPRTWWPHGRRAPRLPPAPRAVARGLHRGRHHLLE